MPKQQQHFKKKSKTKKNKNGVQNKLLIIFQACSSRSLSNTQNEPIPKCDSDSTRICTIR